MRKSKNRYFYHIFVCPGDAPGAITLNVVWMEREFDAYKLSRCMYPSNHNRFWDRARYWSKLESRQFFIPCSIRRPSEYRHSLWYGKTRMVSLPDGGKNIEDIFICFGATHERDRRTDRRKPGDGICICIARWKLKTALYVYNIVCRYVLYITRTCYRIYAVIEHRGQGLRSSNQLRLRRLSPVYVTLRYVMNIFLLDE